MVREGLITLEEVEVVAYRHRFLRLLPADRPGREIMTYGSGCHSPGSNHPGRLGNDAGAKLESPSSGGWARARGGIDHSRTIPLERAGLNARLAVAQRLDEDSLRAEMEILRSSSRTLADVLNPR